MSEYAYNAAGLVTRLENKLADGENETILSSWDYAYRLDGIQTSKTDNDGVKTSYTYDMVGRLTQEQTSTESEGADGETEVTVTGTIAYAYDGCGNRTSATATGFPVYSESYSYDGANRLVSRTRIEDGESVTTVNTYDANGNLIRSQKGEGASAEVTTRGYNGFGQQVSHTTAEREVWFRYRPDGLRHSKRVTTSSGVNASTHLWDGQDIVAEVSTNGTTKASYLRGNGELVAQVIGDATSYYLHNAHGDVTERVDASGVVLKSYNYDAYGNIINPAVVGDPSEPIYVDQSPFGYCGEYLDKETGEIYLRARYYDSTSGAFTAEDPLRDNANWYSYCGADPVNNEDPTGLASIGSWLKRVVNTARRAVTVARRVSRVVTVARTVSRAVSAARSVVAQAARAAVPRAAASPAVAAAVNGAMAGAGYSSGDSVGGNNSAGSILWKNEVSASITSEKVLMDSFLLRLSSTTTVKSVENTSGNPLSPYTVINNNDKNPINSTSGLRIERGLLIAEYVVGMSDISSSLGIKAPDGAHAKIRAGINGVNGSLFIAADTSTAPVENTTTEQSYVLEINGALLAVSVIFAAIMYMMGVPVPLASPT